MKKYVNGIINAEVRKNTKNIPTTPNIPKIYGNIFNKPEVSSSPNVVLIVLPNLLISVGNSSEGNVQIALANPIPYIHMYRTNETMPTIS